MNNVLLSVVRTTETKNGNFHVKVAHETKVATPFGEVGQRKHYYFFTATKPEVGFQAEMDLDLFDVVEKPYFPNGEVDETTGEVNEPRMLKTLYPKRTEA